MKMFRMLAVLAAMMFTLVACGATDETYPRQPEPGENTNPQNGWVIVDKWRNNELDTDIIKRCDGKRLMIAWEGRRSSGVYFVEDSSECGGGNAE